MGENASIGAYDMSQHHCGLSIILFQLMDQYVKIFSTQRLLPTVRRLLQLEGHAQGLPKQAVAGHLEPDDPLHDWP